MLTHSKLVNSSISQRLLPLLAVAYVVIFSLNYLTDPLAQAPQLDARENIDLASQFHGNFQAEEPFYRAVLYPYLLSLPGGVSVLPVIGLLLGTGCHVLNGFLVFLLAQRIWRSQPVAYLSSGLYLLNPVSLFFAGQILDITMAITLFLASLCFLTSANPGRLVAGGLLLGLTVALRPHFLPLVLVLPIILLVLQCPATCKPLLLWIPVALLLLVQGWINYATSGDFRILPWQGAYNLWAANKPEANGVYFKQAVDMSGRGSLENPAKAESIYLYGQAHPEESPPYSIDAMNAYWRGKFIQRALENPLQVASLWLFKAYAVVNSYEQYNNLTYSFHKERLPLLKYNPLNWGILFILGTLGFLQLCRERPKCAVALLLVILAYASTLILFYASARFRLPLVPLLAILAAGSVNWFRNLLHERKRLALTASVVLVTGCLTFSSFAGIRSTETYVQDRLLMANANAELGRDATAAHWAREVLAEYPERREAQRIYAVSYFNMALIDDPKLARFGNWGDQRTWVRQSPPIDPVQDAVLGVFFWKWGERERSVEIWRSVMNQSPTPLAAAALNCLDADPDPGNDLETALNKLLNSPN